MANPEHLSILTRGVAAWNQWRTEHIDTQPDLHNANLRRANLREANLERADLRKANLALADLDGAYLNGADLREAKLGRARLHQSQLGNANLGGANLCEAYLLFASLFEASLEGANLERTDLRKANLQRANLRNATLCEANLSQATLFGAYLGYSNLSRAFLSGAFLTGADLSEANLSGADLAGANLERSILVKTTCNKATFTGCYIHGISAWDLRLEEAQQTNLVITPSGEPEITVDQLEVAQFIYLLLNNQRIRQVIDTITSKVVLILGRFTPERVKVLEAIRENLRNLDYLPVLFNFDKPETRDITETVSTLAHMARFVIADITDAKSIPQELMAIVPNLPSVAVQPLLLASQREYGMFEHFKRFPWVLDTVLYQDQETLLRSLESTVILPAEQKAKELIAMQRK
ncbi:MAG: pentapeptide repeat-containing protein [Nitrospira sp.]|nr:pentapeptide repeat-containing protein [Nitrospira sp.]